MRDSERLTIKKLPFRGVELYREEIKVLNELEELTGKEFAYTSRKVFTDFKFSSDEGHVTRIGLPRCNLKEIPPELIKFNLYLKRLVLFRNQIREIPNFLQNFTSLSVLDFVENKLSKLPPLIGKLTNLIKLFLDYNEIVSVPDEIGELINLETLSMMRNNLKAIPTSIGNLKALKHLNLAGNRLTELPETTSNLRSLQYFNLNGNNLKQIPESLKNLSWVEEFHIAGNPLETFPTFVYNLPNLKYLILDSEQKKGFSKELKDKRIRGKIY